MNLEVLCESVELIICDVDGVLTPGSLIYDNRGFEIKQFNIRDGQGIEIWQRAGYRFGILSGRTSQIVKLRAAELGIEIVKQGFPTKLPVAREIAESCNLALSQVCYIGDDLPDLPVIKAVGLGVAVADAAPEVIAAATFVTQRGGGCGAVRELIELVLKAKHRWQDVMSRFE
jgi:3-deoxy-D-manno-octulosonate 8-phosphate phosphatase (KDO 8-P phosphatase)